MKRCTLCNYPRKGPVELCKQCVAFAKHQQKRKKEAACQDNPKSP
jgi:hypothetical protein